MDCPRCLCALNAASDESLGTLLCGVCEGRFVPRTLVAEVLSRTDYASDAGAHPYRAVKARFVRANPLADPVKYLPCPSCRELMNRRNFGGNSGVIVDICTAHGVWFDAGELSKVRAFVTAKGLPNDAIPKAAKQPTFVPMSAAPYGASSEVAPVVIESTMIETAAAVLLDLLTR